MSTKTSLPPKNITAPSAGQKGPTRAKQNVQPSQANAGAASKRPAKKTEAVATPKAAPSTPKPAASKPAPKPKAAPKPKVAKSTSAPNLTELVKKKVSRKHGAAGVSFAIYIKKLLKHVAAELDVTEDKKVVNISGTATSSIDQVSKIVAQTIATYARANCSESKRNIVSTTDVMFGTAITFPSKLHSVIFDDVERIQKTTELLKAESDAKASAPSEAKGDNHPSRREAQYGLVFSVSGVDKFIRDFKTTKLSVSNEAPVYLALFVENFVKHLLRKTVEEVRQCKNVNMKPFHIFRAIENDAVLSDLFGRHNMKLHKVGVIPHIFDELIPTKEEKNARYKKRTQSKPPSDGAAGDKKQKRHLPGTKALRHIKDSQGKIGLLMQKAPFERVVRDHIIPIVCNELSIENGDHTKFHFRDAMIGVIQQFVEDSAIDLLSKAQEVAIHCGRHGLQGSDVELAWRFAFPTIPLLQIEPSAETQEGEVAKSDADAVINMHHIGNCSIEHLATRGGVLRKGSSMHDVVRAFIKSALIQILGFAIMRIHYRRAVTINDSDIRFALEQMGVVYIFHHEKKTKTSNVVSQQSAAPSTSTDTK